VGSPRKAAVKTIFPEHHVIFELHVLELIERGLSLNLAGIDSHSGDVEPGETRNVYRTQFCGIEPPSHRRKSPSQCTMDRGFWCSAECLRRVGIRQPHKVPASAPNSRVQRCRHGSPRLCPSLGERLLAQSQLTWQDTSIPQEYRVDLHGCRLPGGRSNRFPPGSEVSGVEAEDLLGEESPELRFPFGRGAFASVAEGLILVAWGWLAGPVRPNLMARRAAKCFSTSIFLIRVIGVPVILSGSSAALVGTAEDIGFELAQASSCGVGWAANCIARNNQLDSPVLLPPCGVVVRSYRRTVTEASGAD
jgi:hypothetical protein